MLDKIKLIFAGLVAASPLIVGIAIGYLGHGVIKIALDVVFDIVKLLVKWL